MEFVCDKERVHDRNVSRLTSMDIFATEIMISYKPSEKSIDVLCVKWEKSHVPLNILLLLTSQVCEAGMAFKIPQLNCSFSAGYFEGTPSFR